MFVSSAAIPTAASAARAATATSVPVPKRRRGRGSASRGGTAGGGAVMLVLRGSSCGRARSAQPVADVLVTADAGVAGVRVRAGRPAGIRGRAAHLREREAGMDGPRARALRRAPGRRVDRLDDGAVALAARVLRDPPVPLRDADGVGVA